MRGWRVSRCLIAYLKLVSSSTYWWLKALPRVLRCCGSALPPDVRRRLCPAVEVPFALGLALDAVFRPMNSKG